MVQDDPTQTRIASVFKAVYGHRDICGGVDGHILSGSDHEDFVGIAASHGHGKAAADDVAEHIVYHYIRLECLIGALLFQLIQSRYDPAARAAKTRRRPSGLYTDHAAVTFANHVAEFKVVLPFAH